MSDFLEPTTAGKLQKGMIIKLSTNACKVKSATNNNGEVSIVANEIFTGEELSLKYAENTKIEVPVVFKKEYDAVDSANQTITLLEQDGSTKEYNADNNLVEEVRKILDDGKLPIVLVLLVLGKSICVSCNSKDY